MNARTRFLAFGFWLLAVGLLFAQNSRFELFLRSTSNTAVTGATVYIVHMTTSDSLLLTEVSGKNGYYRRDNVEFGNYKIYVNGSLSTTQKFHPTDRIYLTLTGIDADGDYLIDTDGVVRTGGIGDGQVTLPKLSSSVQALLSGSPSNAYAVDDVTLALEIDGSDTTFVVKSKGIGETQIQDTFNVAQDTTKLKTKTGLDGKQIYLKQLSSSNTNGGGMFVYADSAYPEGTFAYASAQDGKQWVNYSFLTDKVVYAYGSNFAAVAADVNSYGKRVTIVINDTITVNTTVTVPSNAILQINGIIEGSGSLGLDSVTVNAPMKRIFGDALAITGKMRNIRVPVLWYGAMPNRSTGSDSLAFQKALNSANGLFITLGTYYVHELQWNDAAVDAEFDIHNGTVKLCYDGDGGDGSYMFKSPSGSGSDAVGGWTGIRFQGFDDRTASNARKFADHALRFDNSIDFGLTFNRLFFTNFKKDPIILNDGYVNVHMETMRWGSNGGYCIKILEPAGMERRPFVVRDVTIDNDDPNNAWFADSLAVWYPGIQEGASLKGFLKVEPNGGWGGVKALIENARLEFNHPMIEENGVAAVFNALSGSSATTHIELHNFSGYTASASTRPQYLLAATNRRNSKMILVNSDFAAPTYYTTNSENLYSMFGAGSFALTTPNYGKHHAFALNGRSIENNDGLPASSDALLGSGRGYNPGSIIFNTSPDTSEPLGWTVVYPVNGYGIYGSSSSYNDTVLVVSVDVGSDTVTIDTSKSSFRPGSAIVIPGAGTASADLVTYVVEELYSVPALVIATNIVTDVSNVKAYRPQVRWKPFGIVGSTIVANVDSTGSGNAVLNDLIEKLIISGIMQE